MAATEVSVSVSFSLHHPRHHVSAANHHRHPFIRFPKPTHYRKNLSFSLPASSSSPSPPPPSNPNRAGRFLTTEELENLEFLQNYSYHQQLESGLLWVRLMREEETDMTATLLSESFSESMMMMMTTGYLKLLEFLIKNYLIQRRAMAPHNATLLGIFRGNGEDDFELAGTVELTFDRMGANTNPPTPTAPKNSPYICNMAVRKPLRRRGIGWHLLKAGEELITKFGSSKEVYLHCRVIDKVPFNMYTETGYSIVGTDSMLTWLKLQRRRHLMRKKLPVSDYDSGIDFSNEKLT